MIQSTISPILFDALLINNNIEHHVVDGDIERKMDYRKAQKKGEIMTHNVSDDGEVSQIYMTDAHGNDITFCRASEGETSLRVRMQTALHDIEGIDA